MIVRMVGLTSSSSNVHDVDDDLNPYKNMVIHVMGVNQGYVGKFPTIHEEPNVDVASFSVFWKILMNHYRMGA